MDPDSAVIEEFPDYFITTDGKVLNQRGWSLTPSVNQRGILYVTMMKGGLSYKRAIAPVVAAAFLPPAPFFKGQRASLIHKDGNRHNCSMDNLLWRTRAFAIDYHQQFMRPYPHRQHRPIEVMQTGEVFDNSFHLATYYGVLERKVVNACLNYAASGEWNVVPPIGLHVRFA